MLSQEGPGETPAFNCRALLLVSIDYPEPEGSMARFHRKQLL